MNPAPSESEIAPIRLEAESASSTPSRWVQRPLELARVLLALALMLLLVEWALWLRGLPGADVTGFRGSPRSRPSVSRLGAGPSAVRR
ncbi:MAG: hypothetical protein AUI83_17120 [Armatimonadetes bacterium 13_1_40CM_3_65_7]|nr:MAG: hypothetical protein AUI83_17120 [Armatimonadetes bacterium 13_1_40CM_3_65_7]